MGVVWEGYSLPSRGRVWGYNLKLISTLHNDSIPETPSGKKWGGHVQPSPPRGNAPDYKHCIHRQWLDNVSTLLQWMSDNNKLRACSLLKPTSVSV